MHAVRHESPPRTPAQPQGGLTLMAVGAAVATASRLLSWGMTYSKRHLLVTAEIDSR